MIYQKVLCIGDSQTFGARSKAGYPEYLSTLMREKTEKKVEWVCVNEGVNHETVLQILRRSDRVLAAYPGVFLVCLLAGTNDTRGDKLTPLGLFGDLYRQLVVRVLATRGDVMLFPATIPIPMTGFAHLPYRSESKTHAREINCVIEKLAQEYGLSQNLVRLDDLGEEYFVDAVHFNDAGCQEVARRFADKILSRAA